MRRESMQASRKRRQDRLGIGLCLAVLVAFAALLYGAYKIDESRGITISESLASQGL